MELKKTIEVAKAETFECVRVSKEEFNDNFNKVTIKLRLYDALDNAVQKELTLWEGEAYTAIGQYTDADIDNRIKELL